jgi:hypothetical protein
MLSRMRTGRNDDAQIDGDLPADQADALEQIAALGGIDQLDQPVADFQLHRVEIEQLLDFFRLLLGGFFLFGGGFGGGFFCFSGESRRQPAAAGRPARAAELGQPGEHHQAEEDAAIISALGLAKTG